MKRSKWNLAAALLLVAGVLALPGAAAAAPAKGTCLVCKVTNGEAEEEPIRAHRTHEGREYDFCSEKCARAFTADPAAYVPPDFPRPAPAFSLVGLDGAPLSAKALVGKVVLLDFWATWCVPCRKSMPELQALHEKYASRGFVVVGVSIDEGGDAKVRKFVAAKKLTYPIAVDAAKDPAWEAFHVKAVPAAYLLDREGKIVAQWTGAPADAKDLEARLESMLKMD